MSSSGNPWLTIITIVRNDPQGFKRTIESVSTQDLDGVQILVIDGSEDRNAIPAIIETCEVSVDYVWETPAGIYPAMNTGLRLAQGEFSMFANAGDALASSVAISEIRRSITSAAGEWGYGQVRFIEPNGKATLPAPFDYSREKSRCFSSGRFPPHQGTFARTQLLRDLGGFDTRFRICADYAMFLRLSEYSEPIEIDSVIADFYVGGLSSVAWRESLSEFHEARRSILRPSGSKALREQIGTWSQLARMSAVRLIKH